MTRRVPDRKVGHLTFPGYRAGNSPKGDEDAVRRGQGWVDRDCRWTKDRVPINTHWGKLSQDGFAPRSSYLTWGSQTWAWVSRRKSYDGYRVRSMYAALENARHHKLRVEIEAKEPASVDEWLKIASQAAELWGKDWPQYVQVKCLTTVYGWRQILHAAHHAGFVTIALCRGRARWYRLDLSFVTYVRGNYRIK